MEYLLLAVLPALNARRLDKAMFEAAPLLDRDPERAREIIREAMPPRQPGFDGCRHHQHQAPFDCQGERTSGRP